MNIISLVNITQVICLGLKYPTAILPASVIVAALMASRNTYISIGIPNNSVHDAPASNPNAIQLEIL
jgi:hypothetical protein